MPDQRISTPYATYGQLRLNETEGVDYDVQWRTGPSGIAVMAIHGGGIEPGTTEIADALAGDRHTFYAFSGLKASGNAGLHISSRKFDEPTGRAIAQQAWTVVSIHGCKDRKAMTYVGGRHAQAKNAIRLALATAGFPVADALRFPGVSPKNICNRGRSGAGLQLEISIEMRRQLFTDLTRLRREHTGPRFADYIQALQAAIERVFPRTLSTPAP